MTTTNNALLGQAADALEDLLHQVAELQQQVAQLRAELAARPAATSRTASRPGGRRVLAVAAAGDLAAARERQPLQAVPR